MSENLASVVIDEIETLLEKNKLVGFAFVIDKDGKSSDLSLLNNDWAMLNDLKKVLLREISEDCLTNEDIKRALSVVVTSKILLTRLLRSIEAMIKLIEENLDIDFEMESVER